MARFNRDDLDQLGYVGKERLQRLLVSFHVKVDEKEHDVASMLANALSSIDTLEKKIEFKNLYESAFDREFIEASNDIEFDKNEYFKEKIFVTHLTRFIIESLNEEANAIYAKKIHLKAIQAEYRDRIKALSAKNHARYIDELISEKERIEAMYRAQLDQMRKELQEHIRQLDFQIDSLNEEIEVIQKQKLVTVEKYSVILSKKMDDYLLPDGKKLFGNLSQTQNIQISREIIVNKHEASWERRKLLEQKKQNNLRIDEIRTEELQLRKAFAHSSSQSLASPQSGRVPSERTFTAGYNSQLNTNQAPQIKDLHDERRLLEKNNGLIDKEIVRIDQQEQINFDNILKKQGVIIKDTNILQQVFQDFSGDPIVNQADQELTVSDSLLEIKKEQVKDVTMIKKEKMLNVEKLEKAFTLDSDEAFLNMDLDDILGDLSEEVDGTKKERTSLSLG